MGKLNIPSKLGQYCWCPIPWCHQVISSHDIDCVQWPCSSSRWITTAWMFQHLRMTQNTNRYLCTLNKFSTLTHWGQLMPEILVNIGSGSGLSPVQRQAITWTYADILINWTLTNKLMWNLNQYTRKLSFNMCIWKCCVQNSHFVQASVYYKVQHITGSVFTIHIL